MQNASDMFREPGQHHLSPVLFAATIELDSLTLASALGVHVNTMRLHPESAKTQERLHDYCRVFIALVSLGHDMKRNAFHMKNTPIRLLGYRTLFEVVKDGDTDMAIRYLDSISTGQNG